MNPAGQFCPQCGSKVSSEARFCASCGNPLAIQNPEITDTSPDTPSAIVTGKLFAGFWRRTAALGLDLALLMLASIIAQAMVPMVPEMALVTLSTIALYFIVLEASPLQGTLGKWVYRIKVTNLNGGRITLLQAVGRNLAKLASLALLGCGFLVAAFSRRKQALHDYLSHSLVTSRRARMSDIAASTPAQGVDKGVIAVSVLFMLLAATLYVAEKNSDLLEEAYLDIESGGEDDPKMKGVTLRLEK